MPSCTKPTRSPVAPVRSPAGFTLIEMLVVISLLAVLMGLITTTLWGSIRVERAGAATFRQLLRRCHLADQFRADVAGAVDSIAQWDRYEADPECLILWSDERHVVVYRWKGSEMIRLQWSGPDQFRQVFPLVGNTKGTNRVERISLRFERDERSVGVITMHLTTTVGRRGSSGQTSLEIAAALGGNRR